MTQPDRTYCLRSGRLAKKTGLCTAMVVLSGFVPLPSHFALAASASAQLAISASIVQALSVEATRPLSFGKFIAEASAGTLVINPSGQVETAKNIAGVDGFANGGLKFQGTPGVSFSIKAAALAGSGQTFKTTGGLAHLTLTRITIGSSPNGVKSAVALKASGNNSALVQLQGNGSGANNVGGGVVWQAGSPAVGSYSGVIKIEINRI